MSSTILSEKNNLIDISDLTEMLYGESKYMKEFAEAALASFSEFKENYQKYLLERDEKMFRKAGHKIKPVAQMLKIDEIVEEYEHAKTLIWDEKPQQQLEQSAQKMNEICSRVLEELHVIIEENS